MARIFFLLIWFFFSLNSFGQFEKDTLNTDNILHFINFPETYSFANGELIEKSFHTYNQERIKNINNALTNLPIDRCHHGQIKITVYVDSTGNLLNVNLLSSINEKLDSSIASVITNYPGKWNPAILQGKEVNFTGKITFILLNNLSINRSYRVEEEKTDYRVISYHQTKKYDHKKFCADNEFYFNQGVFDFKKGDYKNAIKSFSRSLSNNPYDVDALFNLACLI